MTKTELTTQSQWIEVLSDVFGERLVKYSPQEKEDLWKKVWSLHEAWKRSKAESQTE